MFSEGKAFSVCLAFMDASPQRQFIETTVYRTTVHRTPVHRTTVHQNDSSPKRQFTETIVHRTTVHRMTVDRNDSYAILSFVTDIHKTSQSRFHSLSHLKRIPFLSYFTIIHNCSLHCCSDLWFSCF